jgi:hypothetical protein
MAPAAESERGQAMGKPLGPWSALSANAWQRMPRFAPPVLDCDVVLIRLSAMLIAPNVSSGTARFRQLSEALRKTYVRGELFAG